MEVEQVKAAATSSWSELPADRIGQVLLRLPSLADRVRLRSVCRPWRTDAQRQPALPSPLPWFALRDGGLVDQHGAPVRCAPFLRQGVFEYLAVDNLAFLVHKDGGCSLVNPLSASMAATLLPQLAYAVLRAMNDSKFDCYTLERTKMPYAKVILSSPLDSSGDTLVAALILGGDYVAVAACKRHDVIGLGSVSDWTQEDVYRTIPNMDYKMCLADIAFLHGRSPCESSLLRRRALLLHPASMRLESLGKRRWWDRRGPSSRGISSSKCSSTCCPSPIASASARCAAPGAPTGPAGRHCRRRCHGLPSATAAWSTYTAPASAPRHYSARTPLSSSPSTTWRSSCTTTAAAAAAALL